ncbi:hypothetical protein SDC9_162617 [bioreactor metagenome]|uniref:Uncharacterized protein n=1 Tax=bioreactor metagenome TaxID=1076179 RepID=A0A645FLJ6_9ZZZZ
MSVATFCHSAITFILLVLLGYRVEFMSAIVNTVIPLLIYNVIVAIPIHQVIYRVSQIK